ncbi:hypothetical protein NRK68_23120 [Streptomyces yangpuensis]|uniref:Uncharacterized protein n=1 Tax=Streptomyces yangpuensis TaxID=1648182 RepID=A0ABY5Q115_9ACTN|nr:hypothetical protein [Streptomyces yangpuensis]UUY49862.1 hypothetical protein NRK68_23120 [Streptomyces yangpuensis]
MSVVRHIGPGWSAGHIGPGWSAGLVGRVVGRLVARAATERGS